MICAKHLLLVLLCISGFLLFGLFEDSEKRDPVGFQGLAKKVWPKPSLPGLPPMDLGQLPRHV